MLSLNEPGFHLTLRTGRFPRADFGLIRDDTQNGGPGGVVSCLNNLHLAYPILKPIGAPFSDSDYLKMIPLSNNVYLAGSSNRRLWTSIKKPINATENLWVLKQNCRLTRLIIQGDPAPPTPNLNRAIVRNSFGQTLAKLMATYFERN